MVEEARCSKREEVVGQRWKMMEEEAEQRWMTMEEEVEPRSKMKAVVDQR